MKPRTLFDKIWERHTILEDDETLLYVDRCLIHENSSHTFDSLRTNDLRVVRPSHVSAFSDHYVPSDPKARALGLGGISDLEIRKMVALLEQNTAEYGIERFGLGDDRQGILHVAGPELGLSLPGIILTGSDSHSSTHGAFGNFSFGIGASEVAHVLATQTIWRRRPRNMRIIIEGELGLGVTPKDVILSIIAHIGVNGAAGHVIEYDGSTIRAMSMDERMTICNMSIEAGARAGMIAPDEKTYRYLADRPYAPRGVAFERAVRFWKTLPSDEGAAFDRVVELDVSEIVPMVTWGTNPEQALPVTARVPNPADYSDPDEADQIRQSLEYMDLLPGVPLSEIPLDRVFIGSCTNSRIEDLRAAADIARLGQAVIPTWVVPGSVSIKRQAEQEGLDSVFTAAGFEWREPGCSLCTALNGDILRPGERCASTSNRNYPGRQGPGGRTHLMSPPMAAAAAITGRVTDVRRLATERA